MFKLSSKKKLSLIVLAFVLTITLIGCNSQSVSNEKGQKINLIIGTGGVGGTYYPLGGALARIWTKDIENVSVAAQSTGASIENTSLIENGEIELGLTQNDLAEYAVKQQYMFDKKYERMRAIARLFPEDIQIFVSNKSGIKTIEDMKGKRISIGYPGSGATANAEQILEVFGLTTDDIKAEHLSNPDAADRMKDGLIDAVIVTTAVPNANYQEMALMTDVTLMNLLDDDINKIIEKFPFFAKKIIPADMYKGQTKDVQTVAVQSVLVCQKEMDEELVYKLTKSMWESKDELGEMLAVLKNMDSDNPLLGVTIDVHPGAIKYYKEIGKWNK